MPAVILNDGREVNYRVRVSARSRRVRLTINPRDGLVMVAPGGVPAHTLEALANEWRDWIAEQLDAFDMDGALPDTRQMIPSRIELAAVNEQWHVLQRFVPGGRARVHKRGDGSLVLARGDNAEAALHALQRWLARYARVVLPQMLETVAAETGLSFRSVSVRAQRSRWGSCSHRHDISLNQQLLFLPAEWVRHILIHELCHTLELNHSPAFWAQVERFDPHWRQTRAALQQGWNHVPAWAMA